MVAQDSAIDGGRYVSTHATQAMVNALDHLLGWRLIVAGGTIPLQSHVTLIRGALEATVRCRWLADESADRRERVARGYAAKREDYEERHKFETSPRRRRQAPVDWSAGGMSARDRLRELEAARRAAGVRRTAKANITQLMAKYGLESEYRFASGVAHGMEWVLAATHMTPLDEPALEGVVHGIVTASDTVTTGLTIRAVREAEKTLIDLEHYHGRVPAGTAEEPANAAQDGDSG